jgi:hypothetical protein
MKTSLSLVGLIALSGIALAACDGGEPPVAVDGTGGTAPGTGGGGPVGTGGDTPAGTGGEAAGTGGGATSNALFTGTGTWIPRDSNLIGIQGAFYILEDSVKDDVAVEDDFMHTDFTADTGNVDEMGVSKFTEGDTLKPCISGTVPQVVDEMMMTGCNDALAEDQPGACQWSKQWGGGIGLNLNEEGGDGSVPMPWDALTANEGGPIMGFKFMASGNAGGATLRVKAKNPGDETDYCKAFTIVPGVEVTVALSDFKPDCWSATSDKPPLTLTAIESLQWQVVSSKAMGYTVENLCIESLSWY